MHVTPSAETAAQAGVIYGSATATGFECAVTDPQLRRLDYVAAETVDGVLVLGQVLGLRRESNLSFDQAVAMSDEDAYEPDEKVSAQIQVVGFRDDRGLLQVPRTPFRAGTPVSWAPEKLIQKVIGLEDEGDRGAYMGMLKSTRLPVNLQINTLVQKHVSILAKTGAGKSYATGVLLEELIKKGVAIVIIDAHDEYHSLVSPNIDESEVDRLLRFGLKPKAFRDHIDLWTTELNHRSDTELLKLEGTAMNPGEIADLLGGKLSGAQQGILYQAIKDARMKDPLYSLRDIIDQCHGNKSSSKWNVISALEALDSTGLFAEDGIEPAKLVRPGRAGIVSLKGVPPEIQEVVVARLATQLFEARKSTDVPPFLMVVEEAHNYCPERGIGNAVSLGILRTIASEGRKFGMGLCVVSQRPAKVDKNVLSQCNTQLILKVTNPNDLKAIVGSVEGLTSQAADEIARLPVGVAMVAGGDLGMPILVEVRTRQSRHGGAGVDVVGDGSGVRPVPRMKKGVDYDLDAEPAPPEPVSSEPVPSEPSEPKKTRKPKRSKDDPVASEPRSERRIAWGSKADAAAGEDPAPAPAASTTAPATTGPAQDVQTPAPSPVREVPPERTTRPSRPSNGGSATPAQPPAPSHQTEPASERDVQAARAAMEPRDLRVHRVANRVGYVATLKPPETLELLRKAAARSGVAPDKYLEPFAKVGRTHCFKDAPDCHPCPLRGKCAFRKKSDARAARGGGDKGVLGRFFGKR